MEDDEPCVDVRVGLDFTAHGDRERAAGRTPGRWLIQNPDKVMTAYSSYVEPPKPCDARGAPRPWLNGTPPAKSFFAEAGILVQPDHYTVVSGWRRLWVDRQGAATVSVVPRGGVLRDARPVIRVILHTEQPPNDRRPRGPKWQRR